MTKELNDFNHFKTHQLVNVDFSTGQLDIKYNTKVVGKYRYLSNVGSPNQDGYIRVRCNGTHRMKHRLLYWLKHGLLPKEVDHIDNVRDNNSITNLREVDRSTNTTSKKPRTFKQLTAKEVHSLCSDIALGTMNITNLSNKYGRSRVQIKAIISKKYWKDISDQYF